MNKKASAPLIILFAVFYFFAGMILYQYLKPEVDNSRSDMACSGPLTPGDRVTCLIIDGTIPMVILTIFAATGGILTDKLIK
jgi:hypothetical protein